MGIKINEKKIPACLSAFFQIAQIVANKFENGEKMTEKYKYAYINMQMWKNASILTTRSRY